MRDDNDDEVSTPENPSIARLLESALAGLECGADDAELSEALRLLGWPIDAPPSHEVIERLFCECWNALYAFGLRPEWIEPEPEPEPGSGLASGDLGSRQRRAHASQRSSSRSAAGAGSW